MIRHSGFEPQLVAKRKPAGPASTTRCSRSTPRYDGAREIQAHLEEMYGTEVSPTLISSVTDAVMDEVKTWQARPLDTLYPIVYLPTVSTSKPATARVRNGWCISPSASISAPVKELLGLWIAQTEAQFWLQVVTELKNRGVQDIFIACVDGLKEFPRSHRGSLPRPRCSFASCTWCATA